MFTSSAKELRHAGPSSGALYAEPQNNSMSPSHTISGSSLAPSEIVETGRTGCVSSSSANPQRLGNACGEGDVVKLARNTYLSAAVASEVEHEWGGCSCSASIYEVRNV